MHAGVPFFCCTIQLKREGKYHEEPLQGHVPRQARKMTEQEEMAFYEKRYQERVGLAPMLRFVRVGLCCVAFSVLFQRLTFLS